MQFKTISRLVQFGIAICGALIFPSQMLGAQSWGDAQNFGVRESANTAASNPGRQAFDANQDTAWQLSAGQSSGWIERSWDTPQRIAGLVVGLSLPQGSQLQFSYLADKHWVPIVGAFVSGPQNGLVTVTFPGELPATSKLLATLGGTSADQAKVWEVTPRINDYPQPFAKILPKTYSFNQAEYINLKPSRLWDGINGNSWFEPLWDRPWEVFQTNNQNKPDKIFAPYLGNPATNAEIIWELDGSHTIQTLKAYFIQGYRSVQFQFWDGVKWTNAQTIGPNWSNPQQNWNDSMGWQRLDLAAPVTTTRVRITFPNGWEGARYIGELEVWGEGWHDDHAQALVISPSDNTGAYHFTINDLTSKDYRLEVSVGGATNAPLSGEWNGKTFSVSPTTWINEDTVYQIPLAKETIRQDNQFLRLNPAGELRGVVLKDDCSAGLIDLGWCYTDGQFENTTPSPSHAVPALKSQQWDLGNSYQLEKIRVFVKNTNQMNFKTGLHNKWTPITWNNQGSGWWEANLAGVTADKLAFENSIPLSIDEIQLYGTPLVDTKVGLEIWWPLANTVVTSSDYDTNSVIGWLGAPDVQVRIGNYYPRKSDKLFWMPIAQMHMQSGNEYNLAIHGEWGSASTDQNYQVKWHKGQAIATLDQGTDFLATEQSSLALSGNVTANGARCFINGAEASITNHKFSSSLVLGNGFQVVAIEIWDHAHQHLLQSLNKAVYRTVGLPVLQLDLPYGDIWSQSSNLVITGRVGNGTGLSLTLNTDAVPLSGNTFSQTVTLAEGIQTLTFNLKDSTGRETIRDLTIYRDTTPPSISIISPTVNQYIANSTFAMVATSSTDTNLWWKFNNDDWSYSPTATQTGTFSAVDGFYTYTATAQDRSGNISPAVGVPFCVDTTPPLAFTISADVSGWTNNNRPTISFATTDATSGIDHYEYAIDTGSFTPISSPFQLPVLADGVRNIFVKAVDKAGNGKLSELELLIDTSLPPKPTKLLAIPGKDEITLKWIGVDDGEGFQTYRIERDPAWTDGAHTISDQNYGDQSYTDPGLAIQAEYGRWIGPEMLDQKLNGSRQWLDSLKQRFPQLRQPSPSTKMWLSISHGEACLQMSPRLSSTRFLWKRSSNSL